MKKGQKTKPGEKPYFNDMVNTNTECRDSFGFRNIYNKNKKSKSITRKKRKRK